MSGISISVITRLQISRPKSVAKLASDGGTDGTED
jgi:hypothetical protein